MVHHSLLGFELVCESDCSRALRVRVQLAPHVDRVTPAVDQPAAVVLFGFAGDVAAPAKRCGTLRSVFGSIIHSRLTSRATSCAMTSASGFLSASMASASSSSSIGWSACTIRRHASVCGGRALGLKSETSSVCR